MSRSRPTKLEKYRDRKVNIAHQVLLQAREALAAAELAAKTPDDPDVVVKRKLEEEANKYLQEAFQERRKAR